MSNVPKLGNNKYLVSTKDINRMLFNLNNVLANGNITVQNISSGTTAISLGAGNLINITVSGAPTYTFTKRNPGVYYLIFTNSGTVTLPVLTGVKRPSAGGLTTTSGDISVLTIISDGTNLYQIAASTTIA